MVGCYATQEVEEGVHLLVKSVEALSNHCLKGLGKAIPEL